MTSSSGMVSAVRKHRSTLLFAVLYLGEGAPIGFIWWALPTWLRTQGLPVEQIAALSGLLVLPWVAKFLWAPLVDRIRGTRRGLRGFIVVAQLCMGATLLPLVWLDLEAQFGVVRWLLLAHALAAATQDVAVDALALRVVPAGDRGRLNGGMQAGMLVGRSLFGGGALVLSAYLGWPLLIWLLVGCIWMSTASVLLIRTDANEESGGHERNPFGGFSSVLRRRSTWIGLLFAATAGAAYESVGVLCGPMLVDLGIPESRVGWLFGLPVVAATLVGGLVGGMYADRVGKRRMVSAGLIGFVVTVIVLAGLALAGTETGLPYFCALTGLYFCIGVFTVSSYSLFMTLSRPPLAATQFSAFMSATNGCEAWAAWVGGMLVARFDYGMAFLVMAGLSLAALPLLRALKTGVDQPSTVHRDFDRSAR